jgi:hypothetical protein
MIIFSEQSTDKRWIIKCPDQPFDPELAKPSRPFVMREAGPQGRLDLGTSERWQAVSGLRMSGGRDRWCGASRSVAISAQFEDQLWGTYGCLFHGLVSLANASKVPLAVGLAVVCWVLVQWMTAASTE